MSPGGRTGEGELCLHVSLWLSPLSFRDQETPEQKPEGAKLRGFRRRGAPGRVTAGAEVSERSMCSGNREDGSQAVER